MDTYIESCPHCWNGTDKKCDECKVCKGNYNNLTYTARDLLDFLELMGIEIPDPRNIRYAEFGET